jgi:hypothetical protein
MAGKIIAKKPHLGEDAMNITGAMQLMIAGELSTAGFIHITGLPFVINKVRCAIQPRRSWLGHFDQKNGLVIVVTSSGQIWMGDDNPLMASVRSRFVEAPGEIIPSFIGVELPFAFLEERKADFLSKCEGGCCPPVPDILDVH